MRRFTIGIPTYNRASFLRRAIKAAVDQSHSDVEILVSDNASTDETPEVVRSFGDRVRYCRNPENIGSWPNLVKLTQLATGDYFSWLQDDDLIHRDFVCRAVGAFESAEDVTVYIPYSVQTHSTTTFFFPSLYGPIVALDWMRGNLRVIEGIVLTPLSLFHTNGNPPAIAFRTQTVRRAVKEINPECWLYNERIVSAVAAAEGKAAIDPWPGAIFFDHPAQSHKDVIGQASTRWRHWQIMARTLCLRLEKVDPSWKTLYRNTVEETDLAARRQWVGRYCNPIDWALWKQVHPLAAEIRSIATDTPEPRLTNDRSLPSRVSAATKNGLRELTPPIIWRTAAKVYGAIQSILR